MNNLQKCASTLSLVRLFTWFLIALATTGHARKPGEKAAPNEELVPGSRKPLASTPAPVTRERLIKDLSDENTKLWTKITEIYEKHKVTPPPDPGPLTEPPEQFYGFSEAQKVSIAQINKNLKDDDKKDFINSVKHEAGIRKRIRTALQHGLGNEPPNPIPPTDDKSFWDKVVPKQNVDLTALLPKKEEPKKEEPKKEEPKKEEPKKEEPKKEEPKQAEPEKAKADADAKAKVEAEKAKKETEAKAKADADAKAKQAEAEKAKQAEAEKARKDAEAKAKQAAAEIDLTKGDIARVRGIAERETERVNVMAEQNRLFFWVLGLGLITCLILAIYGLARKPKAIRASSELTADMAARDAIRGLQQTVQSLEESYERDHATRSETVSASASLSALNETKAGIETQIRALSNKLLAAEREAAQLRSQLLSNPSSLAQFRESLQRSFDSASAVALPLLESVARLRERLQNDSFRKLARDRVEWTLLEGLTAEIERGLGEAEALLRALPGQLYVWEQPKFQAVIERCSQIEREVSRASSIRSSLVRLILPAYRTAAQREPLPKALDYARDFNLLMPSAGPLSWTMDCDGQGISADPNDARAPWHIRGSKRAGNRTVLFPICTENGSQLFPGVVTYEA